MNDVKDNKSVVAHQQVKTNPFTDNLSGEQAYSRTERIVSALYLVTNHVPETEPVRKKLRGIGHSMLEQVLALRSGFRSAGGERVGDLLTSVREAISLVRMLYLAGYLSPQNSDILVTALDEVGQFFTTAQSSTLADPLHFTRGDFVSGEPMAGASSDTRGTRPSTHAASSRRVTPAVKGQKRTRPMGTGAKTEMHGERRQLIKDILRKSGPIGIKDIASQMVGCSEKTVQRELAVLVSNGDVIKEGSKRWSTYHLS